MGCLSCAVLCCAVRCDVLCCALCYALRHAVPCSTLTVHTPVGVTMKSQKEITLKNDLQLRDRQDIYRNFLLYCMSGDTVALPMGSTVVVERDESEFARLSQLGEVLGLTQFDVANVHKELAETAYRNQVHLLAVLLLVWLLLLSGNSMWKRKQLFMAMHAH